MPYRLAALLMLCLLHGRAATELVVEPSRGFFTDPISVTIRASSPGQIVYTLDGSSPLPASTKREPGPSEEDAGAGPMSYRKPLRLTATQVLRVALLDKEGRALATATHSYIFPDQVAGQEAAPAGYLTEVESWRLRYNQAFDWAMDPDITGNPERHGNLADHLLDLPSLSLVLSRDDFNFLYSNHAERGEAFERPVSAELLYPDKDSFKNFAGFQIDCGLRMQGGGAVIKARKKSFRLLFKKTYGAGKLHYPLFESAPHHATSAVEAFDTVILRAGGNANWSKDEAWKHEPTTYLRDPLVRDSQIALTGYGARSTFVHLYLNGFYFGLYNIAERPDDKFQAAYWGGKPEDYYALNHGGTVSGPEASWREILGLMSGTHTEDRQNLWQRVDVPGFCDYLINQWYFGSGDWPWNNYYGGLRVEPRPGPLRFFTWDAEFSLWTHTGYLESNDRAWANPLFIRGYSRRGSPIIDLWNALESDPEFRLTFADRVHRHCFQDGALTEEATVARFQKLMATVEKAIVAESARWGDSAYGQEDDPRTRDEHWLPQCQAILGLLEGNVAHFIDELRSAGLYPSVDAPQLSSARSPLPEGTRLEITPPAGVSGTLYVTTDASDPRRPGSGEPSASARPCSEEGLTLREALHLKARFRSDSGEWSPLSEALYFTVANPFPLRIQELMVDPQDDQAFEFVELKNTAKVTLPLGNYRFEGIDYRFPPGTHLAPEAIAVLIPNDDPAAFHRRYPEVAILGQYRRHLSNDGETLRVFDPDGRERLAVRYGRPWPEGSRGRGRSLQLRPDAGPKATPEAWLASPEIGGSPGK